MVTRFGPKTDPSIDVRIQTDLVLPGTRITSLDDLIGEIAEFVDTFTPKLARCS
jgi:hypothetical protein